MRFSESFFVCVEEKHVTTARAGARPGPGPNTDCSWRRCLRSFDRSIDTGSLRWWTSWTVARTRSRTRQCNCSKLTPGCRRKAGRPAVARLPRHHLPGREIWTVVAVRIGPRPVLRTLKHGPWVQAAGPRRAAPSPASWSGLPALLRPSAPPERGARQGPSSPVQCPTRRRSWPPASKSRPATPFSWKRGRRFSPQSRASATRRRSTTSTVISTRCIALAATKRRAARTPATARSSRSAERFRGIASFVSSPEGWGTDLFYSPSCQGRCRSRSTRRSHFFVLRPAEPCPVVVSTAQPLSSSDAVKPLLFCRVPVWFRVWGRGNAPPALPAFAFSADGRPGGGGIVIISPAPKLSPRRRGFSATPREA